MITITKEKYGRDHWNNRDVYRIRVIAKNDNQEFKEIGDVHWIIGFFH